MSGTWIIFTGLSSESADITDYYHPKSMLSHSIGSEVERADAFVIIYDGGEYETVNDSIAVLLWL
jgi:hypothetical protein